MTFVPLLVYEEREPREKSRLINTKAEAEAAEAGRKCGPAFFGWVLAMIGFVKRVFLKILFTKLLVL